MNDPLYAAPAYDPMLASNVRSSWPKVVGIIGIVFGGVALVMGALGAVMQNAGLQQFEAMGMTRDLVERHHVIFFIAPMVAAGLGFLLLLGSILLVLRKPVGRPLILIWALLKIGYAFWQAPLSLALQKDMLPMQQKIMQASAPANEKAPDMGAVMESMGAAMQIISVIWLCALPLFMLIWFLRGKIRREVASWILPATTVESR